MRRTETAVRTELYNAFFNRSHEGLLVVDKACNIQFANPGTEKILGYGPGDLNNQPLSTIVPKNLTGECDKLLKKFNSLKNKQDGLRTQVRFLKKDRSELIADISLSNHLHSEKGPLILALFSDVTWRYLNEQKLKEERNHFIQLFRVSPVPFVLLNKASGLFTDVNESFLELFGFKYNELVGKISPAQIRIAEVLIGQGAVRNTEISLKKKSGGVLHLLLSSELLQINGEDCILSTITDITAKTKTGETMLRLNKFLESRVREKTIELTGALESEKASKDMRTRFVTMASHEFRTPLAGILTSLSLLEKYIEPRAGDKLVKHFSRIKSSVAHLTDILNDFLSLDKLQQGILLTDTTTFDLDFQIKDLIRERTTKLKPGQKIHYSPKANIEIFHDIRIIRNSVSHLLSNASKYSGEGKQIDIETEASNSEISIRVKDRGIGIPNSDQQNMFTPFFRAKNAEHIQGTGLGLNIIKKYMELLNGKLEFSSKENEGSVFSITFPQKSSPYKKENTTVFRMEK